MLVIIVWLIINTEQILMIRKIIKLCILLLLTSSLISACSDDPSSPEQQVRNTLDLMQQAAQERSMSDFMDHIADNYSDHRGNDKAAIRRIMQFLFLRNQSINIFTLIHSIDIQNNIAAVELSAAMAARGVDLTQENNRLKADTHRFSAVLEQSNSSEWQIKSVSWKRGWGNG